MTPTFRQRLVLTPGKATKAAQAFSNKNASLADHTLGTPETYPGYYKFHVTDSAGNPGLDIMVNGYNGRIWMNSQMGAPVAQVF